MGDYQVRFCEQRKGRFLPLTRPQGVSGDRHSYCDLSKDGEPLQQWVLINSSYNCLEDKQNCVIFMYVRPSDSFYEAKKLAFIGGNQIVDSWYTSALPSDAFNTIDMVGFDLKKPLPELEVLQSLSQHMPAWFVVYIGPNKVTTQDRENPVVPYHFVLNNGNMLEFVEPLSDL